MNTDRGENTKLRAAREASGKTRKSIARLIPVHENTLANWENGVSSPQNLWQRKRLAEIFGMPIEELGFLPVQKESAVQVRKRNEE